MADFISRFADDKRAAAVCYLLTPALLLVGLVLLLVIAVLAPSASRLRFHALQAILLSISFCVGIGLVYLLGIYGFHPADFITALICIGLWIALIGGIVLVFLIITGILVFKTWQEKAVHLSFIGDWAIELSEGNYTVLKWVVVILGITGAIMLSNHYKPEIIPQQPHSVSQNLLQELDTYFRVFPMGVSKEEVYKKAREMDNRAELQYSAMYGTSYKEIAFSGYPSVLQFMFHDYYGNSSLNLMNIKMKSKDGPIEQIYWQLHKELTERYGQPLETGYPPWRNPGTAVWGSGEGAIWEINRAEGKAFMLMIGLQTEMRAGNGSNEFRLEYKTVMSN